MVLFWTAFGAVGTTLGPLATAIAVIIAVIQYRQPLVKKLNIRFVSAFHVSRIRAGEHLLSINIANTGIRDIVISNVYLSIGKKKLHFDYQEYGREISRTLCEGGILVPRAYRALKNGTFETSTGFKFPTDWVAKNVKMILENQVYLGHMVSHKTQTKSFKNEKLVSVPKEEWIVVRNTHEAIVDEETFELVQKFISVKKRPNKIGKPNIFVGLVKCPDCGRNMAYSNPHGRNPFFRCRTYVRNTSLCTSHSITYGTLQKIVLNDIQSHVKNMDALGDQFIEEMRELSEVGGSKIITQFKQELSIIEKRIEELDSIIMKLFEQNALGKITDERFSRMSASYETEQAEITQRYKDIKSKVEAEEKKTKSTNQFLETIRRYENVTELDRSMLCELIDTIYVYQAEGQGKERQQKIEINYRFLAGSQCGIA